MNEKERSQDVDPEPSEVEHPPLANRTCPRCTFPLEVRQYQGVELDHCRRCGGTFFDPDEANQIFGAFVNPDVWERSSVATCLGTSKLHCPEDDRLFFIYRVEFNEQAVEIDLCKECGGMWFDAREGKRLRDIIMAAGQSHEVGMESARRPGLVSYLFQLASLLPIEVWNPSQKRPIVTITLLITIAIAFLVQNLLDVFNGPFLPLSFAHVPSEILSGTKLWTLVTSSFLHANVYHLLGNTYFLYIFGDNVEDWLGSKRFLLVYFLSAVGGSLAQTILQSDPTVPGVGASAAIAGLMGAYMIFFPHIKLYQVLFFIRFRISVLWYLGFWIVYNLLMAATGHEGVGWMAHIGGFVAGALIAFRYRVRPLAERLALPRENI